MNDWHMKNKIVVFIREYNIPKNYLRALSFLIIFVFTFYRRPDAFYCAQFWGEEGAFFYADAYNFGMKSLFFTCNGYFHLLPRMISLLCVALDIPLHIVAFVFTYSWLFMLLLLAHLIWVRLTLSAPLRFFLIISIVLLPMQSEIVMNLTNIQWIMALFPLIVFSFPLASKHICSYLLDVIILIFCGFTGPNFTLLLPWFFFLLILHFRKQKFPDKVLFLLLLSVLMGFAGMIFLFSSEGIVHNSNLYYSGIDLSCINYFFRSYSFPFIGAYCTDPDFVISAIALCFVFCLMIYWFLKAIKHSMYVFRTGILIIGVLFLFSVPAVFGKSAGNFNPYFFNPRYFFLPALMLVWTILVDLENSKWKAIGRTCLMVWFAIQLNWYVGPYKMNNNHLENYYGKLKSADTIVVPINPEGWKMILYNDQKK